MRVQLSSPCVGWASELPKFLALAAGQAAPKLCAAAPHSEVLRREAAVLNERGEDLRLILEQDCQDVVVLRSGLDVARLRGELEAVELEHAFLDKTAVLSATMEAASTRGWGSIPLRSIGGATGDEGNTNTGVQKGGEYANTPVMEKCCPYIQQIVREIEAKRVLRVRLMRLRPGGVIAPHRDYFQDPRVVRLHVPIVTCEDVEFKIRGRPYHLEEGKLYFTNVRQVHEGENRSKLERIHLVVDVEASLALQDQVRAPGTSRA